MKWLILPPVFFPDFWLAAGLLVVLIVLIVRGILRRL